MLFQDINIASSRTSNNRFHEIIMLHKTLQKSSPGSKERPRVHVVRMFLDDLRGFIGRCGDNNRILGTTDVFDSCIIQSSRKRRSRVRRKWKNISQHISSRKIIASREMVYYEQIVPSHNNNLIIQIREDMPLYKWLLSFRSAALQLELVKYGERDNSLLWLSTTFLYLHNMETFLTSNLPSKQVYSRTILQN